MPAPNPYDQNPVIQPPVMYANNMPQQQYVYDPNQQYPPVMAPNPYNQQPMYGQPPNPETQ